VLRAYPDVLEVREALLSLGAPLVLMSGSGPTLFTPYRSLGAAASLYERARGQGLSVWLCHTVTRAQVAASRIGQAASAPTSDG
jgi:4-diphosphocytidyl-2-C-methyl-D-erythritol kinase